PEIREYKYRQISSLADLYRQRNLPLFGPVGFQLAGNDISPVIPPVVESWGKGLVVIQGNTRATYSFLNRLPSLPCIVIDSLKHELPVQPVDIRRMRVVTRRKEMRYTAYNEKFRKIEESVRPF